MSASEEEQFVQQLQHIDTKDTAFRTLIAQNKTMLYYHIRSIVIQHEDADDVLQETFIKAYENIDSFKGNSKLSSWLFRIATNHALDFLKQKSKMQKVSLEEYNQQLIEHLETDSFFNGDEATQLLHKAIATLPEKQQLVFKMRYFQELDYQSISDILETSVGALKASYHHAMKKLNFFKIALNLSIINQSN
ncbi:RNA polymerase sigma factor [Myroides sp. mNGS23_01]|nr:RNA polymerase sigma factor [Myroides sp. mNGS23_01]WHT38474.1 RNA polymerase sigma factor [Myroides sp. mNGS23_01]